jgi:hypothetical protein
MPIFWRARMAWMDVERGTSEREKARMGAGEEE